MFKKAYLPKNELYIYIYKRQRYSTAIEISSEEVLEGKVRTIWTDEKQTLEE